MRLIFDSFEPYPYSYPDPIILTLKLYQSVVLKVVQLHPVLSLFPSSLWLKSVSDFAHPIYTYIIYMYILYILYIHIYYARKYVYIYVIYICIYIYIERERERERKRERERGRYRYMYVYIYIYLYICIYVIHRYIESSYLIK